MRSKESPVLILLLMLFVLSVPVLAEAVSFSTHGADGGSSPPAAIVGGSPPGSSASGGKKLSPTVLPLPLESKGRLFEAVRLVQATGFQARLAMMRLEKFEETPAAGVEITAGLEHAYKSFEAMEKAARKLDDTVKLTRLALEGRFGPEERLAALRDLFSVLPAEAFEDDYTSYQMGMLQQELDKIAGGARLTYEKAMGTLSDGARAVADFAGKAKNAVKSGWNKAVGTLTTPVAYVHTKMSQLVGWENWAKISAVTKFGATVTVGTIGLVVAVTAMPATAVAAPLVAVGVYAAGNVGAALSLVNDINEIEGRSSPGVGAASYGISKGTAIIGLVQGGGGGEIFVNIVSGTSDDMTVGRNLTEEELESFIKENEELLNKHGLKITVTKPDTKDPYGGGGGSDSGGSGGGCDCN